MSRPPSATFTARALGRRAEQARNSGVALVGLPHDAGSSFLRGAAAGPAAIRTALYSDAGNLFSECGCDLGDPATLADLGDLALDPNGDPEPPIESAIATVLGHGLSPLSLGGDHAVSIPAVSAVVAHHGPIDLLVFDAHPDLYDRFEELPLSHACVFARIMERGLARRLVQVGIRTLNSHQRRQAERFGVEIVEMRHWGARPLPQLDGPLYLSVDLDVLDPAFAPGVSHREPGGATTRQLLDAIQSVDAPIVAADVVELNPSRDRAGDPDGGPSARAAAKLVKEIAARMLVTAAAPPGPSRQGEQR